MTKLLVLFTLKKRSSRRVRNVGDDMDLSCSGYSARYLVGTHSAQDGDMKYFASRSARSKYVSY